MHPADIQSALKKRGITLTDIGNSIGVSKCSISNVMHGRTKSLRVATAIAKLTGRSLDELFPGQYPDQRLKAARLTRKIAHLQAQLAQCGVGV